MKRVILFLVLLTLLCSCKMRTISVPVETVKAVYKDVYKRDSIIQYDSVFVDRWKSNDTVFMTKEKYKYIYRDRLSRDSVYIRDTIRVPFPMVETKTIKAPYTWYEKILLALGSGILGYVLFRWIKR